MRLTDVATINTNMAAADFWIVRRGSIETIGTPVKQFNPEHIGIRVFRIDILIPEYLFFAMTHLHTQGMYKPLARGTLALVNIRT